MKGHSLMQQAIARVNKVCDDKQGGLIVDHLGMASDPKQPEFDVAMRDAGSETSQNREDARTSDPLAV